MWVDGGCFWSLKADGHWKSERSLISGGDEEEGSWCRALTCWPVQVLLLVLAKRGKEIWDHGEDGEKVDRDLMLSDSRVKNKPSAFLMMLCEGKASDSKENLGTVTFVLYYKTTSFVQRLKTSYCIMLELLMRFCLFPSGFFSSCHIKKNLTI